MPAGVSSGDHFSRQLCYACAAEQKHRSVQCHPNLTGGHPGVSVRERAAGQYPLSFNIVIFVLLEMA